MYSTYSVGRRLPPFLVCVICFSASETIFIRRTSCLNMGFLPAINVVVAGAAARVAHYLLYQMCDGRVFGTDQLLRVFLLEVPSQLDQLNTLLRELKKCCFPLIEDLVATVDPPTAFQDADVAILLTAEAASPHSMTQAELLRNVKVFRNHGMALEEFSRKSALVVLAAEGSAAAYNGAMAAVCARSAPSIPKANFSAVSRLLEDWAAAMVGARVDLDASYVDGALIWGNSWGVNFLPDFYHATVTLPEKLARLRERKQPARKVVADDLWLKRDLHQQLVKRQNLQRDSRPARYSLSHSVAITKHIHDLWQGTEPDKAVSMAVFSDGSYDVPPGLMFTMPAECKDHSWKIKQLPIDSFVELSIKRIVRELENETKKAMKVWEEEERDWHALKSQN